MTVETLLSVQNLSHSFDNLQAVKNLNFNIQRGEVVALLGTNGAGKSTALNILTGNLKPDAGIVSICDHDVFSCAKLAKQHLGYLPDVPPLYRELNVYEFLLFAARIHAVERKHILKNIERVIETCGLASVTKKLIASLSKGFKQRVGIAQAIIHNPDLVVLDEPTVGLDPVQMQDIRALLKDLSNNHSVLLSTHLLNEAEETCDRVLIIDKGCLLLDQNLAELSQPSHSENNLNRVKLRFSTSPTIEELNAIPGCESVSCTQYGKYICRYSNMEFIQNVQAISLQKNWHLYEISSFGSSLEQVFLDLVVRDPI